MLRRLMFFGVGALISIIVLSIGDNRVKDTFVAYINYFNPEKRVINQFLFADHKIYLDSNSNKLEINSFLNKAWVNNEMTDKDSYPQVYVLDNVVISQNQRLHCRYYDMEKRDETIFDPTKEDNQQPEDDKDPKCHYDKRALTYTCDDGYFCRFYKSRQKWRCNDARRRAEYEMLYNGSKICKY